MPEISKDKFLLYLLLQTLIFISLKISSIAGDVPSVEMNALSEEENEQNSLSPDVPSSDEENDALKKEVELMINKLTDLEQQSLKNYLEIHCVPELQQENLTLIVQKIAKILHTSIAPEDIDRIYRIDDNSNTKTYMIYGAIAVGGAIIAPIAVPATLGALGFGAAGVTAGSVAAGVQSAVYGGTVASGSIFAVCQSVGAAGLGTVATAVTGASGATASVGFAKLVSKFKYYWEL